MGRRSYSWRSVPLGWASLVVLIWIIGSPLGAQEATTEPSEPTSTPTSEPLQLSGPTSQRLLKIFQTLDLRLGERETQIGKLEASQSSLSKELAATANSLEKASASLEQANKDNDAKDERIADLEGQIAREAARKRVEIAWWRAGALTAAAGLLGSAFGWRGAAIGALTGAAGGATWALTEKF